MALSASRSGTIGLVIARDPSVITAEGYYMRTLFGVEQYLNEADGSLLLRLTGEGGEDLDVYRRWARQRRVDGFLLFDEFDDDPRLPLLTSLGMPGVLVTSRQADDDIGRLVTPEIETVTVFLDHLRALGHERIAHISGPMIYVHERVRADLLTAEGERRGMEVTHLEGTYAYESGAARTRELLSAPRRPTAVLAGNDIMATAALRVAGEAGAAGPGRPVDHRVGRLGALRRLPPPAHGDGPRPHGEGPARDRPAVPAHRRQHPAAPVVAGRHPPGPRVDRTRAALSRAAPRRTYAYRHRAQVTKRLRLNRFN